MTQILHSDCGSDELCMHKKWFAYMPWVIGARERSSMEKDELVNGMTITEHQWNECEVSHLTKQNRKTCKTNVTTNLNELDQLVYAGVMSIRGNNTTGFKYLLVIIDAFSNFTTVFLLKQKSEVNRCMKEYVAWQSDSRQCQ